MGYPHFDILFFERPLVDLRKFAFKITKELKKIDSSIQCGAIALELPTEKDPNEIDYFFYRRDVHDIDAFFRETGIKLIVLTQNRVPDLEIILHAKKLGIKTVMVQEGIMFDGTNINDLSTSSVLGMFKYIPKVLEYTNIMRRMCRYASCSFTGLIAKMVKERIDLTTSIAKYFDQNLACDYVFTMGEFWDDYYVNRKGYSKEQIKLVGDHDLDGFIPSETSEEALCYIANTLVEDGTISAQKFDGFVRALAEAVDKHTKIYMKLHPRSDKSLYSPLMDHNVEFIDKPGYIPSVNLYIGHRSALLGKALYESDNLIIWRFPEEKVCFYEEYATAVCMNAEELRDAIAKIDISKKSNLKRDIISKVYWLNPNGSISTIASNCVEYMKTGAIE